MQHNVVELSSIAHLEEAIITKFKENDNRVLGAMAQWLQAVGGVQFEHLTLSFPCQLSGSLLRCYCVTGKRQCVRDGPEPTIPSIEALPSCEGFRFAVPAFLVTQPTYCWAMRFLPLWLDKMTNARGSPKLGMVFHATSGENMTCEESLAVTRTALTSYGTPTHPLTSEAWKRASSILLEGAAYSPMDVRAFGDWQGKEDMTSEHGIRDIRRRQQIVLGAFQRLPARGNRYFWAEQAKLSVYVGFRQLIQYGSWACIPEEKYGRHYVQ